MWYAAITFSATPSGSAERQGDVLVRQHAGQRLLVDDRPRDALINRAVDFALR
jgi:hypothetical protein